MTADRIPYWNLEIQLSSLQTRGFLHLCMLGTLSLVCLQNVMLAKPDI